MVSIILRTALFSGLLVLVAGHSRGQEPPPTSGGGQTQPPVTTGDPPDATDDPPAQRRRGRGGPGGGRGRPGSGRGAGRGGPGDGEASEGQGGRGRGRFGRGRRGGGEEEKPKKPRKGIKVTDPVVIQNCAGCHKVEDDGFMSRVSFMRKSPEGWEMSLKRMIRMHHLSFAPEDARQMVRYLSNHHGLARGEAERALYEAERRVHWSESDQDDDIKRACASCHTLGRVFSQQRTSEEWQHLKKMHMALYTNSSGSFGERRGGSRGRSEWRGFGFGGSSGGASSVSRDSSSSRGGRSGGSGRGEASARQGGSSSRSSGGSRADRVMARLAKEQPLFSSEWEAWQVNEREVPVAGLWTVVGHEVGRGPIRGTVEIARTGRDAYSTAWVLEFGDGSRVSRQGRGVVYAGYSWRGRSRPSAGASGDEPAELREVMLLSEDWNTFRGRCFHGAYSELGMDVTLHRHQGATQIFASDGPVMAPASGAEVVLRGTGIPADATAGDFHLGKGVTVKEVKRENHTKVALVVDVAADARLGKRRVSFRAIRGADVVTLYDTIDYLKIGPKEGFSRVGGGGKVPKQYERFEAWAMHRGPDKKPYTDDDWPIKVVPASWRLEEFAVHEYDDDVKYVGEIDPKTGFFTPAVDGPNPKRRWSANNIGNVYVMAEATLKVPVRPPEPEPEAKAKPDPETPPASAGEGNQGEGNGGPRVQEQPAVVAALDMEEKTFKARGHLLVSVPLYIKWDRYEWDHQ